MKVHVPYTGVMLSCYQEIKLRIQLLSSRECDIKVEADLRFTGSHYIAQTD